MRHAKLLRAILTLLLALAAGAAFAEDVARRDLPSRTRAPLKPAGSVFLVPIEVNGTVTLDFMIDSGAAAVMVTADVFSTLKREGTIKNADILGQQTYTLADGSKKQWETFTIRSLRIGDMVVENVKGGVISSQGGRLLLGQSFLQRFKSWSINNATHELVLETETAAHLVPVTLPRQERPAAPQDQSVHIKNAPDVVPKTTIIQSGQKYAVLLSAQHNQSDAELAFRNLQRKFPSVLSDRQANIVRAERAEVGVYYRVLVGSFSTLADAQQLCSNLKALGGDCATMLTP
jgi:clan AA aspartic protease (TIGR02281 family)